MHDFTLNEYVQENIGDPVDFPRLINALDGKVDIIRYLDLGKYDSLVDLFDKDKGNNVILYYPVDSEHDGHFVAMMYYPEKDMVNYFCPYGMSINGDIQNSTYLMKQDIRMKFRLPELVQEFQSGGGHVYTNRSPVQSRSRSVATCGKHCTFRIIFRDIEDPMAYVRFLKYKGLTPDEIVTLAFI
jgi:hypothetical protein